MNALEFPAHRNSVRLASPPTANWLRKNVFATMEYMLRPDIGYARNAMARLQNICVR